MDILVAEADVELEWQPSLRSELGGRPDHVCDDHRIVESASLRRPVQPSDGTAHPRGCGLGQVEARSVGGDALEADRAGDDGTGQGLEEGVRERDTGHASPGAGSKTALSDRLQPDDGSDRSTDHALECVGGRRR